MRCRCCRIYSWSTWRPSTRCKSKHIPFTLNIKAVQSRVKANIPLCPSVPPFRIIRIRNILKGRNVDLSIDEDEEMEDSRDQSSGEDVEMMEATNKNGQNDNGYVSACHLKMMLDADLRMLTQISVMAEMHMRTKRTTPCHRFPRARLAEPATRSLVA